MTSHADLVLYNGNLITLEPTFPRATALAIQMEQIAWVGNDLEAKEWIGSKTHLINLKGSYVYPGFIDSHARYANAIP